jgi:pyroglutamyl-peptidase
MARVLLTSFETFGGSPRNSSIEVGQAVYRQPPADVELDWLILPVVARKCVESAWARIEQIDPALVLALGQTGLGNRLQIEHHAHNHDHFLIPDNEGNQPQREAIVHDGPSAYPATIPTEHILGELSRRRVPVRASDSAGTYVCNHLYYGLLHRAAQAGRGHQTGFLHLPLLPFQVSWWRRFFWRPPSLKLMAEAVRSVIVTCVNAGTEAGPSSNQPSQRIA